MKKCIIIINIMSGNSDLANRDALEAVMGKDFEVDFLHIKKDTVLSDLTIYDRIVVCGGDGTLHNVINREIKPSAELIYCPFGTLNECATGTLGKDDYVFHDVGIANNYRFTYVCACGTFTPLGYAVKNKYKRRFKSLAYLSKVFSHYRAQFISAKISCGTTVDEGLYTLIMAIESPKCFGFNFNKMYKYDDGVLHLLAIKSPKRSGFLGSVQMFFPLFRAFFVGFKKEYHSKHMLFKPFTELTVELEGNTDFCMDGEHLSMDGKIKILPAKSDVPIRVVSAKALGEYLKNGKII